jgi:hypothetical protein
VNINDWDEHLSAILFSYQTAYKIGTNHTPFQFVYGLHPLLPTEYMLPSKCSDNIYPQPTRILTNRLSKLKKLYENMLIVKDLVVCNQWNRSL